MTRRGAGTIIFLVGLVASVVAFLGAGVVVVSDTTTTMMWIAGISLRDALWGTAGLILTTTGFFVARRPKTPDGTANPN